MYCENILHKNQKKIWHYHSYPNTHALFSLSPHICTTFVSSTIRIINDLKKKCKYERSIHTGRIRSVSALMAVRPVHLCVLACASTSLVVDDFLSQLLSAFASISLWMPLTEEAPYAIFHIVSIEFKFNIKKLKPI